MIKIGFSEPQRDFGSVYSLAGRLLGVGLMYAAVPITIPICVAAAVGEMVGDRDMFGSLASG